MQSQDVPVGPLALDTDVFSMIHLKRGDWQALLELIEGHPLALPFPVVGELKVLGIRARWEAARLRELDSAIGACVVLPTDARVVDQWAVLYARCKDRLKGGGVNDLWIAACCLVYGLPLVTGNLSDFRTIGGEFPALKLVHPEL